MKVYALAPGESWVCDQLVQEWKTYTGDMACERVEDADLVWLLADWCWRSVPYGILSSKKVVTTVHHIVPAKFDRVARMDFAARDSITDLYHVYNQRAFDFIRPITAKPITLAPYWANQNIWRPTVPRDELRKKFGIPDGAFVAFSAQRDTEGSDLKSPKLEKGVDLLADAIINGYHKRHPNLHVLLAGWRRQYLIGRLTQANVPFTYIERPPQPTVNELYQCADLYPVCSREEGGPQSLLECGLLGVPVVSRPVGIAEQVLPPSAINEDVLSATPAVPIVGSMTLPNGIEPYRRMFEEVMRLKRR